MRSRRPRDKKNQSNISLERITILFDSAEEEALAGNLRQADRNIALARRISTRTKTRIPAALKRRYCRHCHGYLMPGKTSRTRINAEQGRVEVTCMECGGKSYYRTKPKR